MKTIYNFKNYSVTAKLKAKGVQFPFDTEGSYNHNKFLISVKNNATGDRTSFYFFGSVNDYNNGKVELNEEDLKHAFYCLISDSLSAVNDFEDFCSEFGYNTDSRTAERIYKGCKKQYNKAIKLVDNESDLYDLANELND
jgi:hypothetical protein